MYFIYYRKLKSLVPEKIQIFIKKFIKKNFKINKIDKALAKYLNYKKGYFIEIGANDGINQSNTIYLENKLAWNGVLVEPIRNKFLELKKNRSQKNFFFNNACTSFSYKKKFVEMMYSDLMTTSDKLENDIDDPSKHAREGVIHLDKGIKIHKFSAKSERLNKILLTVNAPKLIDFFSLDVEGSEIEVLKGIDFSSYNFKYLLIETRNFKKISQFLFNRNYKMIEKITHHDYLFGFDG